jgi:orotate phosphoribosyltransferase
MKYEAFHNLSIGTVPEMFLYYALDIEALELPPEGYTLDSGRISPYFFNSGLFNKGRHIDRLTKTCAKVAEEHFEFDVVYGPAYKGIPLAVGISMALVTRDDDQDIGYAFNRKEAKDHGEGGTLVGCSLENKRVLIVDDAMTTGTSSSEAVDFVKIHGGIPVGAVIAFDRQERGENTPLSATQEFTKTYGIPVVSVANFDLLFKLVTKAYDATVRRNSEERGEIGDLLGNLAKYRLDYGA